MLSRGFFRRGPPEPSRPILPGQHIERGFPVLSAGPTPRTPLGELTLWIENEGETLASWSWERIPHYLRTTMSSLVLSTMATNSFRSAWGTWNLSKVC